MARVNLNQTSFHGGEWSPRALGRTDIDRYSIALKRCRNAHPVLQGGVRRRDGSRYVAPASSTTTTNGSIILPFIAGRESAFLVEFSDTSVRVLNSAGAVVFGPASSPYTAGTLSLLDWAQSDATMWLFHPQHPTHRLQLLGGGVWVLSPAPFTNLPFAETGFVVDVAGTLSAATVGVGRTLTVPSARFEAADVGRGVISNSGIAVITAFGSGTSVTVEITRAFTSVTLPANDWTVESSPQTTCTASAKDPVGATITLTLGAAGWRAANVGSHVRINGGLAKISGFTSSTVVNAVIVRELSSIVAAPALAWSLEPPSWSAVYGYPRTGTVYQQRLIVAGNLKFPRTVWGSRLGETLDFTLGVADDDAFSFTLDGDESSPIAYVSANKDLAVFTESAELSMRGGVEKPITPTNVRIKPESNHGSANVRPVSVGREVAFVQRSGKKIRAFGYRYDFDGYSAPDVSSLAEHLFQSGVLWLAYQQEPDPIVWAVNADGSLTSCTFDRDQAPSVVAWAKHDLGGAVECVAVIPSGGVDVVWVIVRRTINGAAARYIERLDGSFVALHPSISTAAPVYGCTVDSGIVVDNASGQTTFTVSHLIGKTVAIVADGSVQPSQVVPPGGSITLARASKRTLIGLPFTSEMTLLPPEFGTPMGSAQGKPARTGRIALRLLDSVAGYASNDSGVRDNLSYRNLGAGTLDSGPDVFTGVKSALLLGWKIDGELTIGQDLPLPQHLLSVVREHSVNG
jgi:hypothetical protein